MTGDPLLFKASSLESRKTKDMIAAFTPREKRLRKATTRFFKPDEQPTN
ncbi:hypothetical protein GF325_00325 [Candidatus Bathyarchaeota archaeon]|nr:hypothetical protein [Candidatus Bathyarchaeota archaeon]